MIQQKYAEWCQLRLATETCAGPQGVPLVARMGLIEADIAGTAAKGLVDVLAKMDMALLGAEGLVESARTDLAGWVAEK